MKVITTGKRLVTVEHVAFVEPFEPTANSEFKLEKEHKGRFVLLDHDIVPSGARRNSRRS
jgi:transcription termination factor Rho